MNRSVVIWLLAFYLVFNVVSASGKTGREIVSLNGIWEVEDSIAKEPPPEVFKHKALKKDNEIER